MWLRGTKKEEEKTPAQREPSPSGLSDFSFKSCEMLNVSQLMNSVNFLTSGLWNGLFNITNVNIGS